MQLLGINWTVEKRKVADLKLWAKNPRTITEANYERLKQRIVDRGFHDVLKIDTDGTVLSGNQRKNALVELGVEEVFCMVPERKLTDVERDSVGLESNITDGKQDYDMLANKFDDDLLKSIGYTDFELGRVAKKLEEGLAENNPPVETEEQCANCKIHCPKEQ